MIRALFLALLLTACGGGSGGNESGGGTTTPPSPPPDEGTVLDTSCDGTTLVTTIADGNGGSYTEETEKSEECGYEPAPVVVTMERSESDYFKGAIVTVDDPDNVGWDWHVSAGHVIETDTGLEIRRDGGLGRATLTIDGEEYYFDMVEEPLCAVTSSGKYKVDCMGYLQGGASSPMIYYGEEDTQVVQIEIGFVITQSRCRTNDTPDKTADEICPPGSDVLPEQSIYQEVYDNVAYFNEFNEKNGVYFEVVVSGIEWARPWFDIFSFPRGSIELRERSDQIYGVGGSGGNGGQAFQPRTIYPLSTTPASVGVGMGGTMMHEVGHTMGLGHGIWGNPTWTLETADSDFNRYMGGSIFPRFGHGWDGRGTATGACSVQGTVMSYGSGSLWSNSLKTCEELGFPAGYWGDVAGNRLQSDEAYALNRVRYSMSLYHNEHLTPESELLQSLDATIERPEEDPGRLINDPYGPWVEQREAQINEEIILMRARNKQ